MTSERSTATDALRVLFRPIARILLKAGMNWRDVADVCKSVYVDVATREFGVRGRPTNGSRVSIMTGLTRRDVSRIRKDLEGQAPGSVSSVNRATRVLSGWFQDEDFRADSGEPMLLPEAGEGASFESLCKRYCPDAPHTTMLKELQHVGAVVRNDQGLLEARSRVYIPVLADPAQMLRSGDVLKDLGDTVSYNLHRNPSDPSRFERRATNTRIPDKAVPEFRAYIEAEGQAFLERVDAWLTAHEAEGSAKSRRLGFGGYWIEEENED